MRSTRGPSTSSSRGRRRSDTSSARRADSTSGCRRPPPRSVVGSRVRGVRPLRRHDPRRPLRLRGALPRVGRIVRRRCRWLTSRHGRRPGLVPRLPGGGGRAVPPTSDASDPHGGWSGRPRDRAVRQGAARHDRRLADRGTVRPWSANHAPLAPLTKTSPASARLEQATLTPRSVAIRRVRWVRSWCRQRPKNACRW